MVGFKSLKKLVIRSRSLSAQSLSPNDIKQRLTERSPLLAKARNVLSQNPKTLAQDYATRTARRLAAPLLKYVPDVDLERDAPPTESLPRMMLRECGILALRTGPVL
jgi:hypothetical protein